jgi:hypothetical protein
MAAAKLWSQLDTSYLALNETTGLHPVVFCFYGKRSVLPPLRGFGFAPNATLEGPRVESFSANPRGFVYLNQNAQPVQATPFADAANRG